MGMGSSGSVRSAVSEINVTPLIDVLLVLLIIFMVIVPVTPKGMDTLVPQPPKKDGPTPHAVVVQILMSPAGEPSYLINRAPFPRAQIESRLAAIFSARQEKVMFVQADNSLEFSEIAEVIDMGHRAQVDNIGLLTQGMMAGK
jgi:biopolymer transport protein TolR